MKVFVVVVADPTDVRVELVTKDKTKANKERIRLYEKNGSFTYIAIEEREVE